MKRNVFIGSICFVVIFVVFLASVSWGEEGAITLPQISFGKGGSDTGFSSTIQIVFLLTALTLLPAVLLMMTSFARFVIVFSILRHAIGLQQTPSNQIVVGLALFMTFFVMSPVFNQAYSSAVEPYLVKKITQGDALAKGLKPFREFMFKQTREKELSLFIEMAKIEKPKGYDDIPTAVVIPAFMTSELKTAFQIGFIIFIPFLIIDMVVASVLMSMGMIMLPPVMISLPFKLMLFVLVDGWTLLIGSMVKGVQL